MLKKLIFALTCMTAVCFAATAGNVNLMKTMKVDRNLQIAAQKCVDCHTEKTPGIIADWRESRHAHVGVSCMDCHGVSKDSPMAMSIKDHEGKVDGAVSAMVSSKTCAKCHEQEVDEFLKSGHARGAVQMFDKAGMRKLMYHYEGADLPDLKFSPQATGCIQCHGSVVEMDNNKIPKKETWPNYGIATAYPDGGVGSCVSCHSRHKFSIAEARKPAACNSCHLGPDHPDKEIYDNSMHGHIFNAENSTWKWDSAPDTWEVPDFRAPTCAVCHMAGIGKLDTTHNISKRLKWNLWAPHSFLRDGGYETAGFEFQKTGKISVGNKKAGNINGPEAARTEMKTVCKSCHSQTFSDNFFTMADKHVELYNYYNTQAQNMLKDLKDKKLLKDDMWADEFQRVYYHSWHHEGRRMRQGALMGGPDYAHWHGVFQVQQDFRKMQDIYNKRIKSGKIE